MNYFFFTLFASTHVRQVKLSLQVEHFAKQLLQTGGTTELSKYFPVTHNVHLVFLSKPVYLHVKQEIPSEHVAHSGKHVKQGELVLLATERYIPS